MQSEISEVHIHHLLHLIILLYYLLIHMLNMIFLNLLPLNKLLVNILSFKILIHLWLNPILLLLYQRTLKQLFYLMLPMLWWFCAMLVFFYNLMTLSALCTFRPSFLVYVDQDLVHRHNMSFEVDEFSLSPELEVTDMWSANTATLLFKCFWLSLGLDPFHCKHSCQLATDNVLLWRMNTSFAFRGSTVEKFVKSGHGTLCFDQGPILCNILYYSDPIRRHLSSRIQTIWWASHAVLAMWLSLAWARC